MVLFHLPGIYIFLFFISIPFTILALLSRSLPAATQIPGHIAVTSPPSPLTTVRPCLRFYLGNHSAFSSSPRRLDRNVCKFTLLIAAQALSAFYFSREKKKNPPWAGLESMPLASVVTRSITTTHTTTGGCSPAKWGWKFQSSVQPEPIPAIVWRVWRHISSLQSRASSSICRRNTK